MAQRLAVPNTRLISVQSTGFSSLWLFTLCLCLGIALYSPAGQTEIEEDDTPPTIEQQLKTILLTIKEKETLISRAQKQLKDTSDEQLAQQINQQIRNDEDIIKGMRERFVHLSAGGRAIFTEKKNVSDSINWKEDLTAIFLPLIERLKEISERPKKIESLQQDIAYWQERKIELSQAINFIQTTQNTTKDKAVLSRLKVLSDRAKTRHDSAEQQLLILNNKLDDIRSDKSLLWENVSQLLISFASSILYYLVIALILSYVAFQIIVLIAKLPKLLIDKRQPRRYVFAERTINLIKNTVGFIVATTVYLTVLYASGQWVLLVLSLFVIAGFILTLKDMVPKYFVEIRTLLNLGSIRQNERIVFNGLVWRINLIDVYTHIHNPALDAHLRVPIDKLLDLSSRPFHKNEPWFPTKTNDYVILDDGTFGQIQRQSVDMVEINFGGSIYSYPTQLFLASKPRNLSSGFGIYELFGFDYQHQAIATNTLLTRYSQGIQQALNEAPFSPYLQNISVEFDSAASSSLNIKVIANFSGEAAGDYFRISRVIQRASLEIANQEGWVIPFDQLTLHRA